MATKDQSVARTLLEYRYKHLDKAIENAKTWFFKRSSIVSNGYYEW